jgi:CheY-like chemotaxis protein
MLWADPVHTQNLNRREAEGAEKRREIFQPRETLSWLGNNQPGRCQPITSIHLYWNNRDFQCALHFKSEIHPIAARGCAPYGGTCSIIVVQDTGVILVVDDRSDDILLILRAFQKAGMKNPVQVVRRGAEALAYLSGEGRFANRAEFPLPILVLLDLKMPGMDGFEVLSWIRQQDGIRGLPVVVLTSSDDLADVNRAYQLGANSFFVKELDFQGTIDFSKLLKDYWVTKSRTPQTSRPDRKPNGR